MKTLKKRIFICCCTACLICISKTTVAQNIKYSSRNVFINYYDNLKLVSNISGNHHLLQFIYDEYPSLFIFNSDLVFREKVKMPFKFAEKSVVSNIISLNKFYYVFIRPYKAQKYLLWKIDANGNVTDLSAALEALIRSQVHNTRSYSFIENQNELCLVFRNYLDDIKKNRLTVVKLDSSLNVKYTYKVLYDLNRNSEAVQTEFMVGDQHLFVLKTGHRSTSLELIKINLSTGYTITKTFSGSGFLYQANDFKYNESDSSVIVYSVLRTSQNEGESSVFISKLNKELVEESPFVILKSPFPKKVFTDFLLVDGDESKWLNFAKAKSSAYSYETVTTYPYTSGFRDYTSTDPRYSGNRYNGNMVPDESPNYNRSLQRNSTPVTVTQVRGNPGDDAPAVRFLMLDKKLIIARDSIVPNNKNSYILQGYNFTNFMAHNKNYILLKQQFFKKSNGLLMIYSNNEGGLTYTDVMVNNRYEYLLTNAKGLPLNGIVIPYVYRREAGLIKITIE